MKNSITYYTLLLPLLVLGCEGNGPIRLRSSASSVDLVRQQILTMNQYELDQCRVQLGTAGTPSVSTASSSDNNSTRQTDANAFQNAINKVMGSDEIDDEPASSPTANLSNDNNRERITRIDILNRESMSYSRIDVTSASSKTARLLTRGLARVTRDVPGQRNGIQTIVDDSVQVNLSYNLINGSRGWQCTGVNAELITPPPTGPEENDFGGRIGW